VIEGRVGYKQGKAEEAKLIKGRQEGFQEAVNLLGVKISPSEAVLAPRKLGRGKRRNIRQLIFNELSFSGKALTTDQIAQATD
jgi:hypothetical protein